MGFSSAEEYLAAANAVVNNASALHKTEKEDGDDVYYLEASCILASYAPLRATVQRKRALR